MDPEILELKRKLYLLPEEFGLSHSRIWEMRTELRKLLFRSLTGDYAYLLFGSNEKLDERCVLKSDEWLDNTDIDIENTEIHSHHGRPCGRKLERGEPTHRCLTCGLDETCVLCKYCFNPRDHVGHNVFVKISCRDDGGICDCGDREAWRREVHCFCDDGPQNFTPLPLEFKSRVTKILSVIFDFLVDVLSGMSLEFQTIRSEAAIIERTERAALVPEKYGFNPQPRRRLLDKWCLQVWDDEKRSVTDMRAALLVSTERNAGFINMITERIQKTGKATVAVSESLVPLTVMRRRIRHFVTSIRSVEDIMREEMASEIVDSISTLTTARIPGADSAEMLELIGEGLLADWHPGVHPNQLPLYAADLRSVSPQYRSEMDRYNIPIDTSLLYLSEESKEEEMSDVVPEDRREDDHLEAEQNTSANVGDSGDVGDPLESEELFGPDYVYGHLSQKLQSNLSVALPTGALSWPIENAQKRLKLLIFFDVRLNKSIRHQLTDLYVAVLLSNHSMKTRASIIYADVYPLLVDQYIHLDRDTDMSVTTALSTQLFTTPSVATTLMKTDAFEIYMNLLRRIFTKTNVVDPKMFRNRRLGQVFHELSYLLWRNSQKETVGTNPQRLAQAAQFLALFQGMAPMLRRADKHIEYENEKWVYCYASMPYALTLARNIAAGIDGASYELQRNTIQNAVSVISQSLKQWQNSLADQLGAQAMDIKLSYGPFANLVVFLTGIDVSSEPVSLLNPVHAFLSWILEFSSSKIDLRGALDADNGTDYALFDAPMSTLAVVSHISVGYWVRNGYAMRIQLQSYRDATLRDLAYARDIYMTQVALALLEPNTVFMNLVRHFRLINWPTSTLGDTQQAFYLLDEFVHIVNTLLTDRLRFCDLRDSDMKAASLRREILQILGFKSMPYSELTRMIPESLVVDEKFDTVLMDVAVYTPPSGAHGVGKYSLRPELYSEFDPFYAHFNISRCEEAEKEADAKVGPNHTGPIIPLPINWQGLDRFTRSVAFGQFLLRILVKLHAFVSKSPDQSAYYAQAEASFNRVLYLMIMAAKSNMQSSVNTTNCFSSFSELVKVSPNLGDLNDGKSILELLYEIHESAEFSNTHGRLELLVELLHTQDPTIPLMRRNMEELHERKAQEHEEHRQKGKEVQRRILAEMAQQQQQFIQRNSTVPAVEDLYDESLDDNTVKDDDTTEGYTFSKHCVLCQMPDNNHSIFGILTYTSQLRILRDLPINNPEWIEAAYSESPSLDVAHKPSQAVPDTFYDSNGTIRNDVPYTRNTIHRNRRQFDGGRSEHPWGPAFPQKDVNTSIVVQGCGHGAHQSCLNDFLYIQQQRRTLTRITPDHPRDGEFLCPLCKGLNNCFMPVLWNTNDLEANDFLGESNTDDMVAVLSNQKPPMPISSLVETSMSALDPKFLQAIQKHDFTDDFHVNVRNSLLEQMLRIKKKSTRTDDFDQTYGLRAVYRSFADSVSQIEVSLRGRTYQTPFGGLVMDQLPTRVTQFLRVFSKYISTLTGFILSSVKEPQQYETLKLAPNDTFTQAIELLMTGRISSGISPKAVLNLVIATEIGRAMRVSEGVNGPWFLEMMAEKHGTQFLEDKLDSRFVDFVRSRQSQNPLVVLTFIKYHMTVNLRRYALVIFAICGKYDSDDFAGIMMLPEHDRLVEYLGLPKLNDMLLNVANPGTPEGVAFSRYFSVGQIPNSFSKLVYPGIYRLISLPVRLDMMFNIPGRRVDPAVCLMCGEMFTIHASTASTIVGPCNAHIGGCGLSQGIFLLGRLNVLLLLLPQDRGTFIAAPYLDLHGEPDENMRRGRPHYLQCARYDALMRDVWLSNGLPSLIVRKLDQLQDTGGWETL